MEQPERLRFRNVYPNDDMIAFVLVSGFLDEHSCKLQSILTVLMASGVSQRAVTVLRLLEDSSE